MDKGILSLSFGTVPELQKGGTGAAGLRTDELYGHLLCSCCIFFSFFLVIWENDNVLVAF